MTPKIYLVGGYVRDILIENHTGNKSKSKESDLDYVVVGADEAYMTDTLNLTPDDAQFPVFRNKNGDEFALARTEKKVGKGYHGFEAFFSPEVSLEDDLLRRDLTMNSIAIEVDDELKPKSPIEFIDPHGGIKDIKNKVVRHTSNAFSQDPLRVLRVARFASQLHEFGFTIHEDTLALMKSMSGTDELRHLTSERVLKEMKKALNTSSPHIFFEILLHIGALEVIFPEIYALHNVPQKAEYHPEIDCFIHTMMALKKSSDISDNWFVRYMALTHDLGKALTPKDILPSHHEHEKNGLVPLSSLNERLKIPKELKRLSELCMLKHTQVHGIFDMKSSSIAKLLKSIDAERKPENAKLIALACVADAQGRLGFENTEYKQADFLSDLINECSENRLDGTILKGKVVNQIINIKQLHAIDLVDRVKKVHRVS